MAWRCRTSLLCISGLFALASAAQGRSETNAAGTQVHCAGGRRFVMQVEPTRAVVTFGPRRISLPRRQMPLARYYRSSEAALLVDGMFVAFVPEGHRGWRECRLDPAQTAAVDEP